MGVPQVAATPHVSATMHYQLQGYRYAQAARLAHWQSRLIRRGWAPAKRSERPCGPTGDGR